MSFAAMMLAAVALDALLGWPAALFARIGHPVTWLGALISGLDRILNAGSPRARFWTGCTTILLVVMAAALPALAIQMMLPSTPVGTLIGAVLAWPLIAVRSMHDHVLAVAQPLMRGDMAAARHAVSMIVGRDPSQLDAAGVARAGTESLAENTSDGIVAPVFWGVIAGLPGIAAYKAINTLDSMIGHRTSQYEHFGKASARIDDLVNLLPARLCGLVFALASGRRAPQAFGVMWRDAHQHRSPNAGWPESAMAGALQIRLSGPRVYGDRIAPEPWLNEGADDPQPTDLFRALSLYRRAMALMALVLLGLAFM